MDDFFIHFHSQSILRRFASSIRYTGESKGFGFVEMSTEDEAKEAIKRFNGYALDNRNLTVSEARPREERSGGGGYNDRRGGSRNRF
jgi:RNA recognition motif-containing protein